MSRFRFAALLCAAVCLGCTQSDTVPVTGVVTLDGQPAAQAEVLFNPKTGRMASGVTDDQGRFALSTAKPNDGAMPGEYIVTLFEYYPPDKPPKMPPPGQPLPSRFPPKYADPAKSPLTATIERGKPNEFQFDIGK
jgi:hypothetical protein